MLFSSSEILLILVLYCVFVAAMVAFVYMFKNKHNEGFEQTIPTVNTEQENIKFNNLINNLNDWGLHTNKLISVNKIMPSYGFTKIRETVTKNIMNDKPKDSYEIMNEISAEIKKQQNTEGFTATFEETELVNELKDIINM